MIYKNENELTSRIASIVLMAMMLLIVLKWQKLINYAFFIIKIIYTFIVANRGKNIIENSNTEDLSENIV